MNKKEVYTFLRTKAVFMIFIVISMAFMFSNLEQVSADDTSNECCELTQDGDSCVYTSSDNCDTDYDHTPITCEQTAFCQVGTCVSDIGQCSTNVGKATCEEIGYEWYSEASYELDLCQKDCCVIADYQASYTTESHCEYLIEDLEYVEFDYREVESEAECSDIVRQADTGCCVSEDQCTFGTRGECENPDIQYEAGLGFFQDEYCSDIGQCGCTLHDSTICVNEDVYHVDSCGNVEEIFRNCDYLEGTWCGWSEEIEDNVCLSIACDDGTFDGIYEIDEGDEIDRNPHDDQTGGNREHGESWCLYESPAGGYKDFPGSQHYRAYCYFGEEIIEPCADYREEVCIQAPYDSYKVTNEYGLWVDETYSGDYSSVAASGCIDNVNNEIWNSNVTTVALGGQFWNEGYGAEVCQVANLQCDMIYARSSWTDKKFEAGAGIMCTSPQYAKLASNYCNSQGDCGVGSNIAQSFSNTGFRQTPTQEFLTHYDENNKSYKIYVGYDSCVNQVLGEGKDNTVYRGKGDSKTELKNMVEEVNAGEAEAVFCIYECEEDNKEDDTCRFISTIDPEYFYDYYDGGVQTEYYQKVSSQDGEKIILSGGFPALDFDTDLGKNSYGVYGGLIGISQVVSNVVANEPNANYVFMTSLVAITALGALPALVGSIGVASAAAGAGITTQLGLVLSVGSFMVGWYAIAIAAVIVSVAGLIAVHTTTNPIEAAEKSKTLAITTTVAASVILVAVIIGVVALDVPVIGWVVAGIAFTVAAITAIISYGGKTVDVSVNSYCEAWQPPTGSESCELCDIAVSEGGLAIDDGEGNVLRGYDCTEYKCKSLGWGCEYITENAGTLRPKCVGVDEGDPTPPVIEKFMVDFSSELNEQGIEDTEGYVSSGTGDINWVPDKSIEIEVDIEPYQWISFGIETNKLSQCKISENNPTDSYDNMDNPFPDSYFDYQHNQSWILVPEEDYDFWIRCQDHNGRWNIDEFLVRMSTGAGVDVTTPIIETTSIQNGGYVAANVNQTELDIYINEPATCKWASEDVSYDLMEGAMSCSGIPESATSLFDNSCTAYLPVNQSVTNYYYFACEDGAGNQNTENYPFTLLGSEPLIIDGVAPNGTIYYDYTTLIAETSAGAIDGQATCSYGGVNFFTTNTSYHTQFLEDLPAGDYEYEVLCSDLAGNLATDTIAFTIDVDTVLPVLTAVYTSATTVYYEWDEEVTCEYFPEEFEFGEGSSVSGSFPIEDLEEFYLICQDVFGNEESVVIQV